MLCKVSHTPTPTHTTATAIPILGNDGKGTTVRGIINIPRYYHTNREKAPLGARQLSDICCGRYYLSIIFCIVTRNNYFSKN